MFDDVSKQNFNNDKDKEFNRNLSLESTKMGPSNRPSKGLGVMGCPLTSATWSLHQASSAMQAAERGVMAFQVARIASQDALVGDGRESITLSI